MASSIAGFDVNDVLTRVTKYESKRVLELLDPKLHTAYEGACIMIDLLRKEVKEALRMNLSEDSDWRAWRDYKAQRELYFEPFMKEILAVWQETIVPTMHKLVPTGYIMVQLTTDLFVFGPPHIEHDKFAAFQKALAAGHQVLIQDLDCDTLDRMRSTPTVKLWSSSPVKVETKSVSPSVSATESSVAVPTSAQPKKTIANTLLDIIMPIITVSPIGVKADPMELIQLRLAIFKAINEDFMKPETE